MSYHWIQSGNIPSLFKCIVAVDLMLDTCEEDAIVGDPLAASGFRPALGYEIKI